MGVIRSHFLIGHPIFDWCMVFGEDQGTKTIFFKMSVYARMSFVFGLYEVYMRVLFDNFS